MSRKSVPRSRSKKTRRSNTPGEQGSSVADGSSENLGAASSGSGDQGPGTGDTAQRNPGTGTRTGPGTLPRRIGDRAESAVLELPPIFFDDPKRAEAALLQRDVRAILLTHGGRITAKGYIWEIRSKPIGAGIYRVTLEQGAKTAAAAVQAEAEENVSDLPLFEKDMVVFSEAIRG